MDVMPFDDVGPLHDRRWMAVTPEGEFITQRGAALLATIDAQASASGLRLSSSHAASLEVGSADGPPIDVRVWDSRVTAVSTSADADEWLSDALGRPCRLVHLPGSSVRETNPRFAPGRKVSFADGYPALVVTTASLLELQRRSGATIPMERFRPNVVVGPGRAHEEDRWRRFRIGSLGFSGVKLCARCTVTTLDQVSGERDPASEPLRTLGRYRNIEGKVFFGVNVVHDTPGEIRVGDEVHVEERRTVPAA